VTECLPSENEAPSSNFSTVKKPNEPQAFWLYFPASEEALSPWAGVLDTLLGDPQVPWGPSADPTKFCKLFPACPTASDSPGPRGPSEKPVQLVRRASREKPGTLRARPRGPAIAARGWLRTCGAWPALRKLAVGCLVRGREHSGGRGCSSAPSAHPRLSPGVTARAPGRSQRAQGRAQRADWRPAVAPPRCPRR
jgi:hypothetical protein